MFNSQCQLSGECRPEWYPLYGFQICDKISIKELSILYRQTKHGVELIPGIVRIAGREEPPALPEIAKVEFSNENNEIEYKRYNDKI